MFSAERGGGGEGKREEEDEFGLECTEMKVHVLPPETSVWQAVENMALGPNKWAGLEILIWDSEKQLLEVSEN